MTQDEIQLYKNYRGIGTQRLTSKRKRGPSSEPGDPQERPTKRHVGDVGMVVEHCKRFLCHIINSILNAASQDNLRPEVGVKQRRESQIIGLKNFNNWVKSVLITQFGHPALAQSPSRPGRGRGKVLDMGCGKGGDLMKWSKAKIRELLAVGKAVVYFRLVAQSDPPSQ